MADMTTGMEVEVLDHAPKASTRARYIVVDSENQWLVCSYFPGPDEALSAAKAVLRMGDWKLPDELICYQVHEEMTLRLAPAENSIDKIRELETEAIDPSLACEHPQCDNPVERGNLFCEGHQGGGK